MIFRNKIEKAWWKDLARQSDGTAESKIKRRQIATKTVNRQTHCTIHTYTARPRDTRPQGVRTLEIHGF